MNRRFFLQSAAASLAAGQSTRKYRAALIGNTGHGDYGHDWDTAFKGVPSVEMVAVADTDDHGRQKAKSRSGALRDYRDYRQMLDQEKPDLVAICPRWLDQRLAMVTAAAEHGAHVLMEKPFARNLEDADRMVAAAEKYRIKVQVGHTARPHPVTRQVSRMLREGAIGQLMEIRSRGKEDKRAGGEDLIVLGTHCFDLMRYFAGDPQWVSAHGLQDGKEIRRDSGREGTEPVGRVAGNDVAAMFAFSGGLHGYFASRSSDDVSGARFGVMLYGSRGVISVPLTAVPNEPAMILRTSTWAMEGTAGAWERIEPPSNGLSMVRDAANTIMIMDLLEAVEQNREPVCGARDGRWTIEMVTGIYQSQLSGGRVAFPLRDRRQPLA